jgi:hypothetical protein
MTGLPAGNQLVLEITGGERLTLSADGPFVFQTQFGLGHSFAVTLVSPPQKAFAELTRATGVITGDVRDVALTLTPAYAVSGNVAGLTGRYVLELNGSERVTMNGAGAFTFTTLLRDGASYAVAVVESPTGERWVLTGGSGRIAGADVTSVAVVPEQLRTIGGTVSGLRGSGLVLRNNGVDTVTVSADGAFTFTQPLLAGATYDVRVLFKPAGQRVTVRNGSGTVAGSNITGVEVVCEDKTWTHPTALSDTISPDGNDADSVTLACGHNGDAVVAWEYGSRIFASERRNGVWTHPERDVTPAHNPDGGSSFDTHVAVDHRGHTLLVWSQRDGATERVYGSVFRNGVWRDPSAHADFLSTTAGDALHPRVAFDVSGDGYLVWDQYVSGNGAIFLATYHDGAWTRPASPAARISPDTTHAQDVQLAVSPTGHVIVVWAQGDGHNYRIYKSELRNGTWTHPGSLADGISPAGSDAYAPDVAFDGAGNAVLAWLQNDGAHQQVYLAELRNNSWRYPTGVADNISPDGRPAHAVAVAMARGGQAIVVWRQDVSATESGLFKSEYRGGAWTHPSSLTDRFTVGTAVTGFAVEMDPDGNTVIPYAANAGGGTTVLLKSEHRLGVWQHPAALSDRISPPGGDVTTPWVAVDGNDDVVILWRQYDGTNQRAFLSEFR